MPSSQKSKPSQPTAAPTSNDLSSRPATLFIVVFAVTLVAYVLLLSKNYYWDGVFFAYTIENAPGLNATLVHPSHLLDMVLHYLIYRTVLAAGLQPRALTLIQITNCSFGAMAVCVFLRICLDSFKSVYVALVATVLFAFSATWWRFATDADNYILAVLLLLCCFYLALPHRRPRPFVLALVHAAAMFTHQMTVIFFPVAVIALLFQCLDKPKDVRFKCLVKYALTVVIITTTVYFAVFYVATGSRSVTRFATWITYFSPEHGFTFGIGSNLVYSMRSQWRVLLGGRLSFVRDLWGAVMLMLVVTTLGFLFAFVVQLLRRPSEIRSSLLAAVRNHREFSKLSTLCAVWVLTYVVFLFFFIPQNAFYRLFYLPPLLVLLAAFLTGIEHAPGHVRRYRAALFAATFFFSNLTLSQYPYAQSRTNPPLQLALKLNQHWSTGTPVYYASSNSDNLLVRYFNPQTVWVEASPEVLKRDLPTLPEHRRAGWLETTLLDQFEATAEGQAWLAAHTIPAAENELVNRKYRVRFRQLNAASFNERVR